MGISTDSLPSEVWRERPAREMLKSKTRQHVQV